MTFGRYEIRERFDVEGGGEDALATRLDDGKEVRLWIGCEKSAGDPDELRRRLAKIYQAALPRVLGAETVEGRAVLVVQPYHGQTLAQRLEAGPLDGSEALDVAKAIGAGLVKTHQAGVVHGAVGEREIFLTADGRALLLHVGFGDYLRPRRPRAPEDLDGSERGPSSDVFGLSRVLHLLLLGEDPFAADDEEEWLRHRPDPSPDDFPSRLPEGLRRFLARSVRRDLERRIHRAEEFAGDLRVIRASWDSLGEAPPRPLVPFPPVFARPRLLVAMLLAVGALAVVLRACSAS